MIEKILELDSENHVLLALKEFFQEEGREGLSGSDCTALRDFETEDYAILGLIGLLINDKPRVLLGRKQPYDLEIKGWCNSYSIAQDDLRAIASLFLDDAYPEGEEYIYRKVMLEYPKKRME